MAPDDRRVEVLRIVGSFVGVPLVCFLPGRIAHWRRARAIAVAVVFHPGGSPETARLIGCAPAWVLLPSWALRARRKDPA